MQPASYRVVSNLVIDRTLPTHIAGQTETPAVNLVILQEKLLVGILIKVVADSRVLSLHSLSDLVQALADASKVIVELGLDDELVVIQRLQVDGSLNHLLEFSQAVGTFLVYY